MQTLLAQVIGFSKQFKLYPLFWWSGYWLQFLFSPDFRKTEIESQKTFASFKEKYEKTLSIRLLKPGSSEKKALIVSLGVSETIQMELGLVRAVEMAGYTPIVLSRRNRWVRKYHQLGNSTQVFYWDEFLSPVDFPHAHSLVHHWKSFDDLLKLEELGARVGRFTASTALRLLRVGKFDFSQPEVLETLTKCLAFSLVHAKASAKILDRLKPNLALFVDRGYTPQAELFDICLAQNIPAVTWNVGHKSNTLVFKRYSQANRDDHYSSLSKPSWEWVKKREFSPADAKVLYDEFYQNYASGEWYSEVGTQFNKKILEPDEIKRLLGLDPKKKTAIIFPHILWDGTFFWGEDLFSSYEEWMIETVRTAAANPNVNWIIKVHPANGVKDAREGRKGEPAEVTALRRHLGKLPAHIFFIPAESEINTFSFFRLMDYCLTVRGTIGIESASFGIPVLTAGTGRYDHKGFTVDAATREEYLRNVSRIETLTANPHSCAVT
ncbi:MAG: hypothetical protein HYZ84_00115 [Candidatus Omnitrophica bacterium]|nr:hypothetical protein [Candidatus Omnitrophota bacterium]